MASNHYNIAVIGAGPGRICCRHSRRSARCKKVAIVEKQYLGGTCLNVGCIPSNVMLHIAEKLV